MPEIDLFVTNHCNRNCSFCFLKEKPRKRHLSIESFGKLSPLLKKLKISKVALLGGEPTIYPHLSYVTNTLRKNGIGYDIFSNGFFEPKNLEKVYLKNVQVSVHMPHSAEDKAKVIRNMKYLKSRKAKVLFRDTIIKNYNFAETLRFIKQYKHLIDGVRVKIAQPNLEKTNEYLHVGDIKLIKKKLFAFLRGVNLLEISISNCCFLPYCEFSKEELNFLKMINYTSRCRRVFYIDTDLTIRFCPHHNRVFSKNIEDLGKIMKRKHLIKSPRYEKCKSCSPYSKNECMPCLAYNADIKEFRKFQKLLLK